MHARRDTPWPYLAHPTTWGLAAVLALALALGAPALATPWGVSAVLAGVLLFVPQEYVMHRFLLHARPFRHPVLRRAQERLHYAHHRDPEDERYLFGPLWGLLPTAALVWSAYWLALGSLPFASLVMAGTVGAYLHYEWAHYVAHSDLRPRTAWGRRLKAMHLWHHYKNEHYWFGVTAKVPDRVARTFPDVHATEKSATTQDIARSRGG